MAKKSKQRQAQQGGLAPRPAGVPVPGQEKRSEGNDSALVLQAHRRIEEYSGPLPPPEILAAYDEIVPGCAEKIINTFVTQAEHRMSLERTVIEGDSKRAYLGLGAGFLITMIVMGLAYTLITTGQPITGAALAGGNLAALAGVFVYGTNQRAQERRRKARSSSRE